MAVEDLQSALISNDGGYVKHGEQKSFLVSLAKWVLKSAMWLIFVVWIALCSIIPTDFGSTLYSDWVAATGGTLFRETGSLLLLFTTPIMAIAFLAFPYIIFFGEDEEELQQKKKKKKMAKCSLWTFPVLVDGPLGVVSAAEMIGIILFIVFVLSALYFLTAAKFVKLGADGEILKNATFWHAQMISAVTF